MATAATAPSSPSVGRVMARGLLAPVAPRTHVALYVRTALDSDAHARLQVETARYAAVPAYAANFARNPANFASGLR